MNNIIINKVKHSAKALLPMSLLAVAPLFTACDDLFEPALENNLGRDYMYDHPGYAEGILGNAYTRLQGFNFSEVATDDAVSNDASNSWRKMASGTWTSDNNPTERWRDCRAAISYLNIFLDNADKVNWAEDEVAARLFNVREKGEAFGLRAYFMYYLLQSHGGYADDGVLYGVPVVKHEETVNSDFNLPRDTYADCMKALLEDCDSALERLPTYYRDITEASEIPAKYASFGANVNQYKRVLGANFNGRVDGAIVEAIRSRAALMAASPAYSAGSGVSYEQAANYAAVVLDRIGGVGGMDPNGWTWFANTSEIDALSDGAKPAEVLWRTEIGSNNDWEKDNYPPSLYGNGRINPTQNFVDAFPMANGYPISHSGSGFNATDPYTGRDPRLAAYVVYNGSKVGVDNSVITTAADGSNMDALNNTTGSSTRTGYYLRKLLRQDINLNPSNTTTQKHYTPRFRFTEIFLNYAEAANEAWGPTGNGSHAYSAYDVIKAIRKRAGIGDENGADPYLEECKGSKDKMRELIRNERRIELSFEGFRFWDLRRWNGNMNETAKGMSITGNVYSPIDVETRNYKDYMLYGPIPYSEILKYNNLQQNKGW